jgi:hypothetical protein
MPSTQGRDVPVLHKCLILDQTCKGKDASGLRQAAGRTSPLDKRHDSWIWNTRSTLFIESVFPCDYVSVALCRYLIAQ